MKKDSRKIVHAIEFYYQATQLKDSLRRGWILWNVNRERLESIAEHVYGTLMLAIHETEEVIIGDVTPLDSVSSQEKRKRGKQAAAEIFAHLGQGRKYYLSLLDEFEENKTPEARFAKCIDKLEVVLQMKKYISEGKGFLVDPALERMFQNPVLKQLYNKGTYELDDIFFLYHESAYAEFGITKKLWFKLLKKMSCTKKSKKSKIVDN